MASATPSNADQMVTLKVLYEGTTRRAKMTLQEMVPPTLEHQIRVFLHLPPNRGLVIERYSDSASSYVVLDSSNAAVYKQLYRAAKAKSKLKLRVTPVLPKIVPQPVSVADEPEQTPATTAQSSAQTAQVNRPKLAPVTAVKAQPEAGPVPTADIQASSGMPSSTSTAAVPEMASIGTATSTSPSWVAGDDFGKYLANKLQESTPTETSTTETSTVSPSETVKKPFTCGRHESSRSGVPKGPPRSARLPAHMYGPASFAICCNNCEKTIPGTHFHCATCDDGDFDLCQPCVDDGVGCHSDLHWLIKRSVHDGVIVNSRTEVIMPSRLDKREPNASNAPFPSFAPASSLTNQPTGAYKGPYSIASHPKLSQLSLRPKPVPEFTRTCNCCVEERPEADFLHCIDCPDYDLCHTCFQRGVHGHHPKHAFANAVPGTPLPDHIRAKLGPGRNQAHNAICDGCDKYITGVRHKCLDCPDWDYCESCVRNAGFVHAKHRFVPVYEPLRDNVSSSVVQRVHAGICCDGPLCSVGKTYPSYIRGIRYKCAVCHDIDFCANCEASPANSHNKTHPLVKFNTPVRSASVTTYGEHPDGAQMPVMGDRFATRSRVTETQSPLQVSTINQVQTVVDVKPVEVQQPLALAPPAVAPAVAPPPKTIRASQTPTTTRPLRAPRAAPGRWCHTGSTKDLHAVFVSDTVQDGTIFKPDTVFLQTWTLENKGSRSWPAGCVIRFVGGDYMGFVDSAHPAPVSELVQAAESVPCPSEVAPGAQFTFAVTLRSPMRPGRYASYWRLTAPDGIKFGHRLWCDINVREVKASTPVKQVEAKIEPKVETQPETKPQPELESKVESEVESNASTKDSTMIFPKLDKESPETSMYEEAPAEHKSTASDLEELDDDEWDASDDGFLTDEEYDILDASDEEFLASPRK